MTGPQRYLIADVSVDIDSAEQYGPVAAAAWVAIGVYAFGLIAFNAVLLLVARKAILNDESTPLSQAIRFVYKECAFLLRSRERCLSHMDH